MTDDEILDQWHHASKVHAEAAELDLLEAYIAKVQAEDVAIERFGLGAHQMAYQARFSDDAEAGQ